MGGYAQGDSGEYSGKFAVTAAPVVMAHGDELLVCVTGRLGTTARCECGWPLTTPQSVAPLAAPVVLDYLVCGRKSCRAHVILTLEP
jgi:hypothetical protein